MSTLNGLSREQCLVLFLVVLLIIYIVITQIVKRKMFFKVVLACGFLGLFFFGGEIINLNVLSSATKDKLNKVVDVVGDTYIRAEGGNVEVLVGDSWLNINDIAIVGEFTKDNTIYYEGQEIYLGHSGVYNTIKVLQDVGLLNK